MNAMIVGDTQSYDEGEDEDADENGDMGEVEQNCLDELKAEMRNPAHTRCCP